MNKTVWDMINKYYKEHEPERLEQQRRVANLECPYCGIKTVEGDKFGFGFQHFDCPKCGTSLTAHGGVAYIITTPGSVLFSE